MGSKKHGIGNKSFGKVSRPFKSTLIYYVLQYNPEGFVVNKYKIYIGKLIQNGDRTIHALN